MKSRKSRRLSVVALAIVSLLAVGCSKDDSSVSSSSSSNTDNSATSETKPEVVLNVSDAVDIAKLGEEKEYTVRGEIKSFQSYYYGQLTLTDGTNDLSVYGCYALAADGSSIYFDDMDYIPVVGDTITVKGILKTYQGEAELGKSVIKKIEQGERKPVDTTGYTEMSIKDTRSAAVGTKVKITGVVAKRTHTQKMNYNGFLIVDETGSTFVYGGATAVQVKEGNQVTVIGEIDHYIATNEASAAEKIGYQGAMQISNVSLVSNDKEKHEFSKEGIEDTTVKAILDTDVKEENITANIYHVSAIINKSESDSILNYYIDDLDNKTGSYVYTSNNNSDFSYLDQYVGKVVDLYVSPINCKSTSTGAVYRFVPVSISSIDDYQFDMNLAPKFVMDYIALPQFETTYAGDPNMEVITSYSSDIIHMSEVKVSYSSTNTELAYFEEKDGKTYFHVNAVSDSTSQIIVKAEYGDVSLTKSINVTYENVTDGAISVKDAIDTEVGTEIKVRGVVAARTVSKIGVYLIDESGVMSCLLTSNDELNKLNNGDEVVLSGKRNVFKDHQIILDGSTVLGVLSTGNTYSTASFEEKTIPQILEGYTDADTAKVYKTSAYVFKTDAAYPQIRFYENEAALKEEESVYLWMHSSTSANFEFLEEFVGKQVTMEVAMVNWNNKVKCCPISLNDGEKTIINPVQTA